MDRNERIFNLLQNKMRYMFKEVLTAVEKESRDFGINSDFFKKEKGRPKGFFLVRKRLFDHGNEVLELLQIILDQVETTPKKAIVKLDDEEIEQIKEK